MISKQQIILLLLLILAYWASLSCFFAVVSVHSRRYRIRMQIGLMRISNHSMKNMQYFNWIFSSNSPLLFMCKSDILGVKDLNFSTLWPFGAACPVRLCLCSIWWQLISSSLSFQKKKRYLPLHPSVLYQYKGGSPFLIQFLTQMHNYMYIFCQTIAQTAKLFNLHICCSSSPIRLQTDVKQKSICIYSD